MRSVKLLVAMAVMTAFVAGPVLAQDAMSGAAAAPTGTSKPATTKHHTGKKHAHHKKASSSSTAAPADTSTAPAK